jgi:predicted alpha/beta superfamily hydrolase
MTDWHPYSTLHPIHSVVGDLLVHEQLYSPQLDNSRDVLALLPPSYHQTTRRYPVLYMHDGQNLFDAHGSYSGEWQVDETMQALGTGMHEAIIIGLPHQGEGRRTEYNPYPLPQIPGRGSDYIRFIVETVKPLIDSNFRTLPDAPNTGLAGSSMGGLISLFGYLNRPDVFGLCAAFSTAYWFGHEGLLHTIQQHNREGGRIYLDVGTAEGDTLAYWVPPLAPDRQAGDQAYVAGVRRLRDALQQGGYHEGDSLLYVEEEGGMHRESAWARRLPAALRFLFMQP